MANSTYSDEIAEIICLRIIEGESLRSICRDPSMPSVAGVFKWLASGKHQTFVEQYTRAREIQGHMSFDDAREIVDTAEDAALARLRFDQRRWAASKLVPKVYGDKIQQEVTGANGAPFPVMVYIPDNGRDKEKD